MKVLLIKIFKIQLPDHLISCFRDCQQITFITLNNSRFCPLSNPPPLPPVLNGQNQDGWNTNQNQMKNMSPSYFVFQVLKVLLIKICKMQPLGGRDLLFLVYIDVLDFTSANIIFHKYLELHSTLSEKKTFVTNFAFLTDLLKPLATPLTVRENTTSRYTEISVKTKTPRSWHWFYTCRDIGNIQKSNIKKSK